MNLEKLATYTASTKVLDFSRPYSLNNLTYFTANILSSPIANVYWIAMTIDHCPQRYPHFGPPQLLLT